MPEYESGPETIELAQQYLSFAGRAEVDQPNPSVEPFLLVVDTALELAEVSQLPEDAFEIYHDAFIRSRTAYHKTKESKNSLAFDEEDGHQELADLTQHTLEMWMESVSWVDDLELLSSEYKRIADEATRWGDNEIAVSAIDNWADLTDFRIASEAYSADHRNKLEVAAAYQKVGEQEAAAQQIDDVLSYLEENERLTTIEHASGILNNYIIELSKSIDLAPFSEDEMAVIAARLRYVAATFKEQAPGRKLARIDVLEQWIGREIEKRNPLKIQKAAA